MQFLSGSVRLGRLFGIDVHVHVLFLIWIGFELLNAGPRWRTELLFTAMLFGIVLLHELGHCFGARSVGGSAENILLWPLGGLAYADAPMTPWAQFVTVACGPLVNVILCVVSAAVLMVASGHLDVVSPNPLDPVRGPLTERWQFYVALFYQVNLYLLAFNLLPIFPFDGGQLLRTLVWPFLGLYRATLLACQVGLGGAVFLGGWGLMDRSAILIGIALMGALTCWQHMQAARMGLLQEGLRGIRPRARRRPGRWWSRAPARGSPGAAPEPRPGAWEARQDEQQRLDQEVDRILRKVHEQGIHSLSYVERQTLERASRARQRGS